MVKDEDEASAMVKDEDRAHLEVQCSVGGCQYETPEMERKAKRVSKRLSQSVLYHTRINMEEVWQSSPCS